MEPSLDGPWSIGEAAFALIERSMRELGPRAIIEFGSGASSVRLAHAFPEAQVLSIESDAEFFQRSLAGANEHGLPSERLRIELRPLRYRRIASGIYETYSAGPFPTQVDAVLIDGPPHWTKRGREACFYDIAACVRIGGRIYLDDYGREQEKRIARNWLSCYASAFTMSEVATEHGLCVLEKVAAVPSAPRMPIGVALDSWLMHAKRRFEVARAKARKLT